MAEQAFKSPTPEFPLEKGSFSISQEVETSSNVEKEPVAQQSTKNTYIDETYTADEVAFQQEDLYKKMEIEEDTQHKISGENAEFDDFESKVSGKFITK